LPYGIRVKREKTQGVPSWEDTNCLEVGAKEANKKQATGKVFL
jgi:putative hemolysin